MRFVSWAVCRCLSTERMLQWKYTIILCWGKKNRQTWFLTEYIALSLNLFFSLYLKILKSHFIYHLFWLLGRTKHNGEIFNERYTTFARLLPHYIYFYTGDVNDSQKLHYKKMFFLLFFPVSFCQSKHKIKDRSCFLLLNFACQHVVVKETLSLHTVHSFRFSTDTEK